MMQVDKDVRMRVFIIDSLVARSGRVLTSSLISELTTEILQRMIEIHASEVLENGQKI